MTRGWRAACAPGARARCMGRRARAAQTPRPARGWRVVSAALALAIAAAAMAPGPAALAQPKRGEGRAANYAINLGISEAMRYLASDPSRALEILRDLDARFPNRERILVAIGRVFQHTGEADSAIVYMERALRIDPASIEAGRALGMLLYARGDLERGRAVFDALIEANGRTPGAYRNVGLALREIGRYDDALRVFEEGRRKGDPGGALTLDIADVRRLSGDYAGALDDYLDYVALGPRNYRFVRDRMLDALDRSDADEALIARLARRAEENPKLGFAVWDAVAQYQLSRGRLEMAIDAALRADAAPNTNGHGLITLSQRVLQAALDRPIEEKPRYLQMGVRLLDAFTRNHPRQPGTDRALFLLASIHEQFGSGTLPDQDAAQSRAWLERAADEYARLVERYPNSPLASRAYLSRGDLLLRRLHRPREALEAYRNGAVNARDEDAATFAARIASVYVGLGDDEAARTYLDSLIRSDDLEQARLATYFTGLRLALAGKVEAARDTLTALAEQAPDSPWTNDAIELAWRIEEATRFGSDALGDWLEAMRADLVGDTARAREHLEAIVARPRGEPLRERAMLRLARLRLDGGDGAGALELLEAFLHDYPSSELRPDARRLVGRVYERGLHEYERALREYEMVLLEYPDYAFLDDVREDVRRLRGRVGEGKP